MRVALVTGRRAAELVRRYSSSPPPGVEVEVLVLPVDVAAFISPEHLRSIDLSGYDYLLLPGSSVAAKHCSELAGVLPATPVIGPVDASGIPAALEELASRRPSACEEVGVGAAVLDPTPGMWPSGWRAAGRLRVPVRPPPVVTIHEVFLGSSPLSKLRRLQSLPPTTPCVVLGFPGDAPTWEVKAAVEEALDLRGCVGVDSPSEEVRLWAVDWVDLVLSVSTSEEHLLHSMSGSAGVVIVPGGGWDAARLVEAARLAARRGLTPILDPVLEPPLLGLAESVARYLEAARLAPEYPLLAGVGNVYELLDADTPGSVALSVALAAEAGASVVLVTGESRKAVRAHWEAQVAAWMVSEAMALRRPPKDVSCDLLQCREKRRRVDQHPHAPRVLYASEARIVEWRLDPAGYLRVRYDEDGDWIEVTHYTTSGEATVTLRGRDARQLYRAVVGEGLVSLLDHAAYLGYELAWAEAARRLGRSYVQDEESVPPSTRGAWEAATRLRSASTLTL